MGINDGSRKRRLYLQGVIAITLLSGNLPGGLPGLDGESSVANAQTRPPRDGGANGGRDRSGDNRDGERDRGDRDRVRPPRDRVTQPPSRDVGRGDHDGYERDRRRRDSRIDYRDRWYRDTNARRVPRDVRAIRDRRTWYDRYDVWWQYCERPLVYVPSRPIRWRYPMPDSGLWTYAQVERVSENIEYLTRDVYSQMMSNLLPREDYWTMQTTLLELIDAAENYADAVDQYYDWSDSIYDLFFLEWRLQDTIELARYYARGFVIEAELNSIEYYVNKLLWIYRERF